MSNRLHVVCTTCDAVNRLPDDERLRVAACGSCRSPLFLGRPTELDEDRFWRHLERSDLPIAASFVPSAAAGSGGDAFDATAGRMEPGARFITIDADRDPHIARRFDVDQLPTHVLFRNGRAVARKVGHASTAELTEWLAASLG